MAHDRTQLPCVDLLGEFCSSPVVCIVDDGEHLAPGRSGRFRADDPPAFKASTTMVLDVLPRPAGVMSTGLSLTVSVGLWIQERKRSRRRLRQDYAQA
jgi:hypothetical protein